MKASDFVERLWQFLTDFVVAGNRLVTSLWLLRIPRFVIQKLLPWRLADFAGCVATAFGVGKGDGVAVAAQGATA